jgi:predicted NAD-dependent protein-ADP-ribosyltransferase YbiA (DUF1768 family)
MDEKNNRNDRVVVIQNNYKYAGYLKAYNTGIRYICIETDEGWPIEISGTFVVMPEKYYEDHKFTLRI